MTTQTPTTEPTVAPLTGAMVTPAAPAARGQGTPRVVVLGGGVAGLTAAYELQRRLGGRAAITVVSAERPLHAWPGAAGGAVRALHRRH